MLTHYFKINATTITAVKTRGTINKSKSVNDDRRLKSDLGQFKVQLENKTATKPGLT